MSPRRVPAAAAAEASPSTDQPSGCPPTDRPASVEATFGAPGGGTRGTFATGGTEVAHQATNDKRVAPTSTTNHTAITTLATQLVGDGRGTDSDGALEPGPRRHSR
jgi:hypothetical protein